MEINEKKHSTGLGESPFFDKGAIEKSRNFKFILYVIVALWYRFIDPVKLEN